MSLLLAAALFQVGGNWEPFRTYSSGATEPDLFGFALANIGDLDGDDADDLLIGAPWFRPTGVHTNGAASVVSGATGATLRRHDGAQVHRGYGYSVAGGADLDGDLVPDYVVGNLDLLAPAPVHVYSGASGALLRQLGPGSGYQYGWSVALLGDRDRDGVAEIGVMDLNALYLYSGASGAALGQIAVPLRAHGLAALDDIDGDAIPEIALGAAGEAPAGSVLVISGASGAILHTWHGSATDDLFGFDLAAVPDRDGDGLRDLLIGAPQRLGQGYVVLVSTRTGAVLWRWDRNGGVGPENLGQCVGVAGDLDGDAVEDYLMGGGFMTISGSGGPGRGGIWIVSGATGEVLREFEADLDNSFFGHDCVGLGDLDGDGLAEFAASAIGAPFDAFPIAIPGSVHQSGFERFLDPSTTTLSASAGASVTLDFDFPIAAGGWEYRFLGSAAGAGPAHFGVDVPLTPDPFTLGCWSGSYPAAMHPQNLAGLLDPVGKGRGSFSFAPGALTPLIGRTLWSAAVAFPAGLPVPQLSSASVRFAVTP